MTPDTALAVHFTEGVVQQDVSAAGCIRARVAADDRIKTEQRLERDAFEPVIKDFAGTTREEFVQLALHCKRQSAKVATEAQQFPKITTSVQIRGWRASQQVAQQRDRAIEQRMEVGQTRRIAGTVPTYFRERRRGIGAGAEGIAIGQRQEVLQRPLEDAQSVLGQTQFANHLRVEQAHRVTRRGIAKARRKFLGHGSPADYAPALEYADAQARTREITGADEPVVTGADHQGIKIIERGLATG